MSFLDAREHERTTAMLAASSRVDALLHAIAPSPSSEFRRLTIAYYICSLIKRCFQPYEEPQVEAFMFGSVPLRAVLPDGDIDISVFPATATTPGSHTVGEQLRDFWASQLSRALEREAAYPDAPFRIRDVQIIQAEVKLVKCICADVVVDVSFDTVGGLCSVAFLEAADRRIGHNHLFKRSILLLKAWCYYESRLLGAHHGLISSYALEVLVLYIFNLHHGDLHTPLDVMRHFLAELGTFDWERYCLALEGPVPIAELHKLHGGGISVVARSTESLLDADFVQEVLQRYSVQLPSEIQLVAPHFPLKHLNIVDPLLLSNNLGRSVSKASYARVKKALALGGRMLEQALLKDPRSAVEAVDSMFKHTWRSPVRLAADNQAFLARLSSIQLPPAATEAVVAAAASAEFLLHLPGTAAGLLNSGNIGTPQVHLRRENHPVLELLLSDPVRMAAWQHQPPSGISSPGRQDLPHSYFAGNLERLERNLMVARRQRNSEPVGDSRGRQDAATGQPAADPQLLPVLRSLKTSGSQLACSSPVAQGVCSVDLCLQPLPVRPRAAQQELQKNATVSQAPHSACPAPPADSHDFVSAMAELAAVRTRAGQQACAPAALAMPRPSRSPARRQAPTAPTTVMHSTAQDGPRSPKSFAAALRASSRNSSCASLASPAPATAGALTGHSSPPSNSNSGRRSWSAIAAAGTAMSQRMNSFN